MQQVIDLTEHRTGVAETDGHSLEQGAAGHHEERGGHSLVRDVGDRQTDLALIEKDDVEEVPAHVPGGLHVPVNLVTEVIGEL